MHVSFDTSLWQVSFHIYMSHLAHLFHRSRFIYSSLFMYVGLFWCICVSFDVYGSLLKYMGLFHRSRFKYSCLIYWHIFWIESCAHLFNRYLFIHIYVAFHLHVDLHHTMIFTIRSWVCQTQISFHICVSHLTHLFDRSLFIYIYFAFHLYVLHHTKLSMSDTNLFSHIFMYIRLFSHIHVSFDTSLWQVSFHTYIRRVSPIWFPPDDDLHHAKLSMSDTHLFFSIFMYIRLFWCMRPSRPSPHGDILTWKHTSKETYIHQNMISKETYIHENMRGTRQSPPRTQCYGVATISRLLKIIGLFCTRAL